MEQFKNFTEIIQETYFWNLHECQTLIKRGAQRRRNFTQTITDK